MKDWTHNTGKNVHIVIIDTGVSKHIQFNCELEGIRLLVNNDGHLDYSVDNDFEDKIGHGTAIYGIIKKKAYNSMITNINIFGSDYILDNEFAIIAALDYIYNNIDCDIVHMSIGINRCENLRFFEETLDKLHRKGIILVSAFHELGSLSYPASSGSVIGVETSNNINSDYQYVYYENSRVNVKAKGIRQRVCWKDSTFITDGGSSYAAAHMTANIALMIEDNTEYRNMKDRLCTNSDVGLDAFIRNEFTIFISEMLKRNAQVTKKVASANIFPYPKFEINEAVTFPFNKEIHSLIRYHNLLDFKLQHIYGSKYQGHVGKKALSWFDSNYHIENIESICFEDFDTLILGHTSQLPPKIGKVIVHNLLLNCIKYDKKIYTLDDKVLEDYMLLGGNRDKIFFPYINDSHIPYGNMSKLHTIQSPVLGIFGTDSQQGKFSLQLELRKRFLENDYIVAQLGTEPTAFLFDFDLVYPMGHNGTVAINNSDSITTLNQMMKDMDIKEPEIIIVGCQSGTVPEGYYNIEQFNLPQHNFLLGTMPDSVILCVSGYHQFTNIERSIKYFSSVSSSKVIAVVLYPFSKDFIGYSQMQKLIPMSEDEKTNYKKLIMKELNIPCYDLSDQNDLDNLFVCIIDYFSS